MQTVTWVSGLPKEFAILTARQMSMLVMQRCCCCGRAAAEQPVIRWSKVDGVLPVDHVTHDGTLIINRVSADDAGVYECIATDAYKTARSRMELFIIGLLYGRPIRQAIIFSCRIFYLLSSSFWFTAK